MRCLYGKQDMYKDVTDIVKEHFVKDNDIVIPQNTAFNDLFGDIIPNEVKALYIEIGDKKILITEDDIRKHTYTYFEAKTLLFVILLFVLGFRCCLVPGPKAQT